jgi:hypothetical protein
LPHTKALYSRPRAREAGGPGVSGGTYPPLRDIAIVESPNLGTRTCRTVRGERSMATRKRTAKRPKDAVALLKADHAQVKAWFGEFEKSRSSAKKQTLATQICRALTVHCAIEEEIFYPAFLAATKDKDTHHEAIVEHAGAKKLIAEI